ncbi:MAG: sulfotransferase [Pseudomonadota bacterium]
MAPKGDTASLPETGFPDVPIDPKAQAVLADVNCLLFCIGGQRCGTTWLSQQLLKSKQVHFSVKEHHYWNVVRSPYVALIGLPIGPWMMVLRKRHRQWQRWSRYLGKTMHLMMIRTSGLLSSPLDHEDYAKSLIFGWKDEPVVADITPAYSRLPRRAFAEMATLHPKARFLFIMRDPVDRLVSGVKQRSRHSVGQRSGGADAAAELLAAAVDEPGTSADIERSRYDRTIKALEWSVPQDQILYLFFEDLFTEESMARLAKFIGLEELHGQFHVRTHGSAIPEDLKTEPMVRAAHAALAPTYDYIIDRFGDAVPEAWHKSAERGRQMLATTGQELAESGT